MTGHDESGRVEVALEHHFPHYGHTVTFAGSVSLAPKVGDLITCSAPTEDGQCGREAWVVSVRRLGKDGA